MLNLSRGFEMTCTLSILKNQLIPAKHVKNVLDLI
jgi:hypothetical protein